MGADPRRRRPARPRLSTALLALALFTGAAVSGAAGAATGPPTGPSSLLLAVGALPYAMRRRAPLTVLVLASLPVLALIGLRYTSAVIGSGLFLAAYTVAAWRTPRSWSLAVGWVTVLLAAIAVAGPARLPPGELLTNAALFVGAFGLGRSTRVRHANVTLLRERAELAEQARGEAGASGGQRGAPADRAGAARRDRPLARSSSPCRPRSERTSSTPTRPRPRRPWSRSPARVARR